MADLQRYAILFVFVSNALMILAMVVMSFRIQAASERTQAMMTDAAADLISAGRGLRGLNDGAARMIERLASAERQAAAVARMASEALSGIDSTLMGNLQSMLAELAHKGVFGDEQLRADVRRLLDSMQGLEPARFPEWENTHRGDIEHVMAQRQRLTAENAQLRERMEDLQWRIKALQRAERAREDDGLAVEALRTKLDQQREQAARLRERVAAAEQEARAAEQEAGAAEARVVQLSSELQRLRADGQHRDEALDDHARSMQTLQAERDRLQQELERARDTMARMAIEKDFIEEKFLGLDEGSEAATAA